MATDRWRCDGCGEGLTYRRLWTEPYLVVVTDEGQLTLCPSCDDRAPYEWRSVWLLWSTCPGPVKESDPDPLRQAKLIPR